MAETLSVIMRWLHISSMATLVGGMLFGRLVAAPAANDLPPEAREALGDRAAARYRPFVTAAIIGLILSGVYRLMTSPGHGTAYQVMFGIKMLLALHVFAVAILIVKPKNPRRVRMMTGVVISGLTIVLISAWLRSTY